jgi:glycerol-3-phosphate dehydrogenase
MNEQYDIIIVGGGIHGVGVAQAAAASGYKAALLEKHALAEGTSSRSSKLIHGGLRYLESGQFRLINESLREREILLKNAPDLVHLLPFYIPVYKHTKRRPWQIWTGLSLYAALDNFHPHARFHVVPRSGWDFLDNINQNNLQAVYQYLDAQTDDAALTRAVMASAMELGADLLCPMELVSARAGKNGIHITGRHNGENRSIQCRVLVNAAGPWINEVLARITPAAAKIDIDLVQGTHIVLEHKTLQGIYYVESRQDRRAVFIMPWKNQVLVGSTETLFTGSAEDVRPLPHEIEYLQRIVREYFPTMNTDVLESFAGLRVLPAAKTTMFRRRREVILHRDKRCPQVLSIYGGKLTGYRATAEKVLSLLQPELPTGKKIADTATLPLTPVEGELASSC